MQDDKRRKLEKGGWEMGDADKFLALTPEESAYIAELLDSEDVLSRNKDRLKH